MPSWKLHVKWAKNLGLSDQLAELINKQIDKPGGGDLSGRDLMEALSQLPKLPYTQTLIKKTIILHYLLDRLRDFIFELGEKPTRVVKAENLLQCAMWSCMEGAGVGTVIGDYINFNEPGEIEREIKTFAQQVVNDIIKELKEKNALKEIGNCHRVDKKYILHLCKNNPKLEKYKIENWDYSKLRGNI